MNISKVILDNTVRFIQENGENKLYEEGISSIISDNDLSSLMSELAEMNAENIIDEFVHCLEENEHTEVVIEDLILDMMDDEDQFPDDKMQPIYEHEILSDHCPAYSTEELDVLQGIDV